MYVKCHCDKRIESLYSDLKQIGFAGVDVNFPAWDKRDDILSENFEDIMMERYKQIIDGGLKVCQTHLTYYPDHSHHVNYDDVK